MRRRRNVFWWEYSQSKLGEWEQSETDVQFLLASSSTYIHTYIHMTRPERASHGNPFSLFLLINRNQITEGSETSNNRPMSLSIRPSNFHNTYLPAMVTFPLLLLTTYYLLYSFLTPSCPTYAIILVERPAFVD